MPPPATERRRDSSPVLDRTEIKSMLAAKSMCVRRRLATRPRMASVERVALVRTMVARIRMRIMIVRDVLPRQDGDQRHGAAAGLGARAGRGAARAARLRSLQQWATPIASDQHHQPLHQKHQPYLPDFPAHLYPPAPPHASCRKPRHFLHVSRARGRLRDDERSPKAMVLNHRTGGVDRRSTARLDGARRPLSHHPS